MGTIRLSLIFLHIFIIIFTAVNFDHHITSISDAKTHQEKLSTIIHYVMDLVYMSFYHIASIAAVWFSHPYGAGMVRASGILLIGELLQSITSIIQFIVEKDYISFGEMSFMVLFNILIVIALLLTFQLEEKVFQCEKNSMQVELLAETVRNIPIDDSIQPRYD